MITISRILVPIDFSDVSREALRTAVAFAAWYESSLTLLHVMNPLLVPAPLVPVDDPLRPTLAPQPGAPDLQQELHAWLDAAGARVESADLVIEQGDAAARILHNAASLEHGMVVMGTHGRTGYDRFVLGSVAEKVLRKATCPVLTVPPAAHTTASLPIQRLLCAVDFSPSSLAALRFALSIAQESAAAVTLLHVFEWPAFDTDAVAESAGGIREYRRHVEAQALERLHALVPEDARNWCTPTTRMEQGKPHERIAAVAEEERADLIVIGVHGRNALNMALFGSTTNQVVRRATCPVLTLRS